MGVNKYKLAKEEPIEVLRVDNTMVVMTQVGVAWGGGFLYKSVNGLLMWFIDLVY